MTTFRFPNESDNYRIKRDALLDQEVQLRAAIEALAAQRRALPLGGRLKESYTFEKPNSADSSEMVSFDQLFGDHDTLLLYTMMFGPDWDAPCPSCTCIVDGLNANRLGVEQTCAIGVVTAAQPDQISEWSNKRHWHMNIVSGTHNNYILDYAGFDTRDPSRVTVMNVFSRTADGIFHRWASELLSKPMDGGHPRHVDMIWPLWNLLDMTPIGRGKASVPKQDFEHRYFSKHVLGDDNS